MNADNVVRQVLPQFFPMHWLESAEIAFSDFPSRICIGYVLREAGGYSYVMAEELSILGISLDELHASSLANLARLPSASITIAKVPSGSEGWISASDDNFAAVRILLPNVQQQFREQLGDEFLVSLPHRDDCFCWSITQSPGRQAQHAQEAQEQFFQDDYNLTPDILKCLPHGFELHLKQRAT